MLPRQYRLRKQGEFDRVFRSGKIVNSSFLNLRYGVNDLSYSRFGFLASSKVFKKASLRNKVKRRLREVVRKISPMIRHGYDMVLISKIGLAEEGQEDVKLTVESLIKKAGLAKTQKT